jgi:hypothetical protein
LVITAPTKAAALWFGERERLTANTLMSLGQPIGTAIVFGLSPAIVNSEPSNIIWLNLSLLVLSVVFGIPSIWIRNKPKTPPSKSAAVSEEMTGSQELLNMKGAKKMKVGGATFLEGVKSLLRNRNYLVLWVVFGFLIGCFNTYVTLISDYITPFGYSEVIHPATIHSSVSNSC